jgi:phosphoribosylaminoimidazole carboxylase
MMMEAANRLNLQLIILDAPDNPSVQISSSQHHVSGSFKNYSDIKTLASSCSLLTVEIEHVDCDALEEISKTFDIPVHPAPSTLRMIQDKYLQKLFLRNNGLPLPDFENVSEENPVLSLQNTLKEFGLPVMLKSKTLAYDGRGNKVIRSLEEIEVSVKLLKGGKLTGGPGLYVEKWAPFIKELAVMVARDKYGNVKSYPCVETIQKDNICHLVIAPAQIDGLLCQKAQLLAEKTVALLEGAGVFGVEMFLLSNGLFFFIEK